MMRAPDDPTEVCSPMLTHHCRDWWWEIEVDFCWTREAWDDDTCDGPLKATCERPTTNEPSPEK